MITIEKWPGLVSNASPYAIPPGSATVQINLQCLTPGSVAVRSGLTALTFASADAATQPVVSVYRYQNGTTEHLVYQDASGKIFSSVRTGNA